MVPYALAIIIPYEFNLSFMSTGLQMTYDNHNKIARSIFAAAGVAPHKVTHAFRVYAAQAMYEMGVPLEVSCISFDVGGEFVADDFSMLHLPQSLPERFTVAAESVNQNYAFRFVSNGTICLYTPNSVSFTCSCVCMYHLYAP